MDDLILRASGDSPAVRPGVLISVPGRWCQPVRVMVDRVELLPCGDAAAWGWEQASGRYVRVAVLRPH